MLLTTKMVAQIPLFYFLPTGISPKYGFLPGVKIPIFKTVVPHDLKGKRIHPIYKDKRSQFTSLSCSDIVFQKDSEFEGLYGSLFFKAYFDSLLVYANAVIDTINGEKTFIYLEVLSPQFIGIGNVKVHGLCQFSVQVADLDKRYCTDIKDGDPNSPIGAKDFVTRKTAYRKMTSASIRESIEKFITEKEK